MCMKDLIGKVVRIYPGDTDAKWGEILEINENGVLFKITESRCSSFRVDTIRFISYSANLTFAYEG